MLKISTRTEDAIPETRTRMVECPACGRKLFDVQYAAGVAMLCIKCTRCKRLVKVNMTD